MAVQRKQSRMVWLVLALLLVLGAGLLSQLDLVTSTARAKPERVVYPRDRLAQTAEAAAEDEAIPAVPQVEPGLRLPGTLPKLALQREARPLQKALAVPGRGSVVIGVGALRASDLAARVLRCRGAQFARGFEAFREQSGLDLQRDVDEIGFSDGILVVGGRLHALRLPDAEVPEPYGKNAAIYTKPGHPTMAKVGDGLLLLGEPDALRAAVDRVEGRTAVEEAPPDVTGAQVNGRFAAAWLQQLFGDEKDPMTVRMLELVREARVRIDVGEHAAVSLDFDTKDAAAAGDLGKAVQSLLTIVRQEAIRNGRTQIADLLAQAKVVPGSSAGSGKAAGFGLDIAVPGDLILDRMGCTPDGTPKVREEEAEREAPPAAAAVAPTPMPATPGKGPDAVPSP